MSNNNQTSLTRNDHFELAEQLSNKLESCLSLIDSEFTHDRFVYNFAFLLPSVLQNEKTDLFYKEYNQNDGSYQHGHAEVFGILKKVFPDDHNVWQFIKLVEPG